MCRKCPPVVILTFVLAGGCSQAPPPEIAPAVTGSAAATVPSLTRGAASNAKPDRSISPPPGPVSHERDASRAQPDALPDIGELFALPKVVVPTVKQPEPEPAPVEAPVVVEQPVQKEVPPPPLRLVGFAQIDGLAALLQVDGKMNVASVGQSIQGVQVVAIAPPIITLKHGERELSMDLLTQPWFHPAGELFDSPQGPQRTGGPRRNPPTTRQNGPSLPSIPAPARSAMPPIPDPTRLSGTSQPIPPAPSVTPPALPGVNLPKPPAPRK
jgi:hypothetical protein